MYKLKQHLTLVFLCSSFAFGAIEISVNASDGIKPISPYLFGRNVYSGYGGQILDNNDKTTAEELATMNSYNEMGIRFLRMNQGNNSTKHNWRKNISSHPDFYNNVYYHNWNLSAKKILDNMPETDAMYGFQTAGYAASSLNYNFDEIAYKNTYGKDAPRNLDLAGGGKVDGNGNLISKGNPDLYMEKWPADSTIGILYHWRDELKYDMNRLKYWSMDNEPELWPTTHTDMPYTYLHNTLEAPERIIMNFVEVAKKAKAIYPEIKLTGPVSANEWLWCNLRYYDAQGNVKEGVVTDGNIRYCWLEYFIMRIAEEEKKANMKLLDVFDIHWYPTEKIYEHWINWHRVFFDTTYDYPGANGIKRANEGCTWDNSITKEYIFKRINDWLEKYMGKNHGVTLAFTETDFVEAMDPMTRAIVYASFLGTFMDNGVEIFTPWTWREGMSEVVHLFSQYSKSHRVLSNSSNDSLVSAYSSINQKADSMTILLVNRAESASQNIQLKINEFDLTNGNYPTLTLSGLTEETFVSRTNNALKEETISITENKLQVMLPAKSITAIILSRASSENITSSSSSIQSGSSIQSSSSVQSSPSVQSSSSVENGNAFIPNLNKSNISMIQDGENLIFQNPSQHPFSLVIFNALGQKIFQQLNIQKSLEMINTQNFNRGQYIVQIRTKNGTNFQKVILE